MAVGALIGAHKFMLSRTSNEEIAANQGSGHGSNEEIIFHTRSPFIG